MKFCKSSITLITLFAIIAFSFAKNSTADDFQQNAEFLKKYNHKKYKEVTPPQNELIEEDTPKLVESRAALNDDSLARVKEKLKRQNSVTKKTDLQNQNLTENSFEDEYDLFLVSGFGNDTQLTGFSEAGFNDSLIRNAVGNIFSIIEGSFGALLMVGAGIAAIISAVFGSYKNATSMLILAIGTFALRTAVSLFFGINFQSYATDSNISFIEKLMF